MSLMTGSHASPKIEISPGFHDSERDFAATLFWQAFQAKLAPLMRPQAKALAFLARTMDPAFCLAARSEDGQLLGLAGFKTDKGALVGGTMSDLAETYGWIGALWRAPLLALLERDTRPSVFQMDGIFVAPQARGLGVGTALLGAIREHARDLGMGEISLDVIDTNPRARALYERFGFTATQTTDIGPLRHLFGFRSSTQMRIHIME